MIPDERMFAAVWVYQFSIVGTCLGIILVPFSSLIMAHEKMGIYAYMSIFEVILKLILVLILQYINYDKLFFWAAGGLFTTMLYQLFNVVYCRKNFSEVRFNFHREKKMYLQMFGYSFWDFLGSMSSLAQGQGLNMLLNMFFGPVVNAARGIAMTIQGAVVQFSSNFVIASKPQIIKLYAEGNIKEMMYLVYQTSNFSYFLLFLFALPLCLELDYVLFLWLGEYPDYTVSFAIFSPGTSRGIPGGYNITKSPAILPAASANAATSFSRSIHSQDSSIFSEYGFTAIFSSAPFS